MSTVIGAKHQFHDSRYALDWAARFDLTPERIKLFDTIISQLKWAMLPVRYVVELGIGPGYLASRLVEAIPELICEGIDFSQPMLDLAAVRLQKFANRIRFIRANLVADDWQDSVRAPVDAVVSTWALHDLGGEADTAAVYGRCKAVLSQGGILLNGDFIKPDGTRFGYEPGRFPINRHLELLRDLGFHHVQCIALFEIELENPTPAQNYACIKAIR
jgi:ubiquinone/menaquinone biosynthesis C-methylase UbiE